MDRISDLPDNVVDRILERLHIFDAVRTSALSKKWRYKWVTLSKLSLDLEFFDSVYTRQELSPSKYVSLVKTIMLQHRGPLLDLHIRIPNLDSENRADLNHIVRFVLRSGVRKLGMMNIGPIRQAAPSCLFSCAQQLTKLALFNFVFDPPLGFGGFPYLKSLDLSSTVCPNLDRLSSFISSCPTLQFIILDTLDNLDQHLSVRAPRLEEITIDGSFGSISLHEVQNLENLTICLEEINQDFVRAMASHDNIFGNLGNIKHLTLGGYIFQLFPVNPLPKKLSVELGHLKSILVLWVDLDHTRNFDCLLCLFRSAPYLKEVEITLRAENTVEEPHFLSETIEFADCRLEHLRTIKIVHVIGTEGELKFIEFVLSCSPVLEFMAIEVYEDVDKDTKLELSKELMRYSRASPKAQMLCSYDD